MDGLGRAKQDARAEGNAGMRLPREKVRSRSDRETGLGHARERCARRDAGKAVPGHPVLSRDAARSMLRGFLAPGPHL
jgi:hypothetical protein